MVGYWMTGVLVLVKFHGVRAWAVLLVYCTWGILKSVWMFCTHAWGSLHPYIRWSSGMHSHCILKSASGNEQRAMGWMSDGVIIPSFETTYGYLAGFYIFSFQGPTDMIKAPYCTLSVLFTREEIDWWECQVWKLVSLGWNGRFRQNGLVRVSMAPILDLGCCGNNRDFHKVIQGETLIIAVSDVFYEVFYVGCDSLVAKIHFIACFREKKVIQYLYYNGQLVDHVTITHHYV